MSTETEQIFLLKFDKPESSGVEIEVAATPNLESVNDFANVCRVCANVAVAVVPIFEGEGLQKSLADKINNYLPIQVWQEDELPQVLCGPCTQTVLSWHSLILVSQQADAALRERRKAIEALKQQSKSGNNETGELLDDVLLDRKRSDPNVLVDVKVEPADEEIIQPISKFKKVIKTEDDTLRHVECEVCEKSVLLKSWVRHSRSHDSEKRYSCHVCGVTFSDSSNLARHTRQRHEQARPHTCPHCHKTFARKTHLQDHVHSHSHTRDFICDVCGKGSKSKTALRMHKKVHENSFRFKCVECGGKFKRRGELTAHVKVHTGERAHMCFCGETFRLRAQLNSHIIRTHDKKAKELSDGEADAGADAGAGTNCGYCGSAHATQRDLHRHLVHAHLNHLFLCEECDTYVDLTDFLVHMTGHAAQYETPKDKPNEAEATDENQNDTLDPPPYCNNSPDQDVSKATDSQENEFSDHSETDYGFGPLPESVFEAIEDSQDSQSEHVRTSHSPSVLQNDSSPPPKKKKKNKQNYTCEICAKVYHASSSYFYHKKNHHGPVKQNECSACGKKFTSKDCLRQHMLTHGEEYQYKCDSCEKKFRTKASLYIHKQTHTGVKKFSCGQCAMSFRWRTHLARHLVRHAGARAHACATCGRGFSVRADLLRHARTHAAPAQRHPCPHCTLNFAQLRYLKTHQANKHPASSCAT